MLSFKVFWFQLFYVCDTSWVNVCVLCETMVFFFSDGSDGKEPCLQCGDGDAGSILGRGKIL